MKTFNKLFNRATADRLGKSQTPVVLLIIGLFSLGTAALYIRANADAATGPARALPVATQTVAFETHYILDRQFAGRVEAQRETRMAFERAGLVTSVQVEEGDLIAEGQVIATMDVEPLEAERARLVADRAQVLAQLELAQLTTDRQKQLSKEGFSSVQRYDDARLSAAGFEASVASIDAAIRSIDINLKKSVLRAPFDGIVGAVLIDEGAVIDAGMGVADLLDSGATQVRIGLPPVVAGTLTVGSTYTVTHNGQSYDADLIALRSDLDARTQTIAALFEINTAALVAFGEVVHFVDEQKTEARGAWLPLSALVEGEKGLWSVYVAEDVDQETRVVRESVEIIHVDDGDVYVRGTLKDGARVLTGGTNRVAPGQRVALVERVS